MIPVVEIRSLYKSFGPSSIALKGVDLTVTRGEMVALIGPSGSGKSTLLRHMSGLTLGDRCEDSQVAVLGCAVQGNGRLSKGIRQSRANIGYIFQQFNLVNRMTVIRNVLMGLLGRIPVYRGTLCWFSTAEYRMAMDALARVGMDQFAWQRADSLSGGQQQRVAIARALVQQAEIILADEPIASLDPESARIVMEILRDINQTDGKTIIVTLHQVDYARRYCDRAVALRQGEVYFDGPTSDLSDDLLQKVYSGVPCHDKVANGVACKTSPNLTPLNFSHATPGNAKTAGKPVVLAEAG
jgi:phosphonate transport system ATP-binding protein